MNNKLVCFFSATNTTKNVAEKINSLVKGTLFEIEPVEKYTSEDLDWTNKESRSSKEMSYNIKPNIKNKVSNIENYDTIYLGFPIWWYTAPTIIYKFLEENNFTGKNIYVFTTSGSSNIDSTYKNLIQDFPNLNFVDGKRFAGGVTEEELREWIK